MNVSKKPTGHALGIHRVSDTRSFLAHFEIQTFHNICHSRSRWFLVQFFFSFGSQKDLTLFGGSILEQ